MKSKWLTYEYALYGLAFILALVLRLLNLGASPLTDYEAGWVLQALSLSQGEVATVGPYPGYVLLTSALFFLFRDTNALARLVPALAGSLLILLPLLFRRLLAGSRWLITAGVIMAYGLALDPGLVALSRMVGGPILAVGFGLFSIGLAFKRRWALAGIFAGLALLSGVAAIQGLLILTLSWVIGKVIENAGLITHIEAASIPSEGKHTRRQQLLIFGGFGVGTILVVGTMFLIVPQGLAGFASTLSEFLQGWSTFSGIPTLRLPAALVVYQLLVLIFATIAAVRGWIKSSSVEVGHQLGTRLSLWIIVALLLAMLYPSRQVADLAWAIVPLWGLASLELARYVPIKDEPNVILVGLGQAALILIMFALAWNNLLNIDYYQTNTLLYWAVIGGALLMGLVAALLVAVGWSRRAAKLGLVWGLCAVLGLYMLSTTWGVSQLRPNGAEELWTVSPAAGQAEHMLTTLGDLSEWNTGHRQEIDLTVTIDSPSLEWALRDFNAVSYASNVQVTESPSTIITPIEQDIPSLLLSYRGQDFNWQVYPGWDGPLPPNTTAWLAFRQAPLAHTQIILWGRSDLFPGGILTQSEDEDSDQLEELIPPSDQPIQ
jgi:hypothetical protein